MLMIESYFGDDVCLRLDDTFSFWNDHIKMNVYFIAMIATAYSIPIEFRADHPFVYFIRDAETDSIIFSGRLMNFK